MDAIIVKKRTKGKYFRHNNNSDNNSNNNGSEVGIYFNGMNIYDFTESLTNAIESIEDDELHSNLIAGLKDFCEALPTAIMYKNVVASKDTPILLAEGITQYIAINCKDALYGRVDFNFEPVTYEEVVEVYESMYGKGSFKNNKITKGDTKALATEYGILKLELKGKYTSIVNYYDTDYEEFMFDDIYNDVIPEANTKAEHELGVDSVFSSIMSTYGYTCLANYLYYFNSATNE